jgi:hypothetical protein
MALGSTEPLIATKNRNFPGGKGRPACEVKVKVKVTLRLTVSQSVSQSVSLGVEPHLGLMTRYLFLFDSYGLVFVERRL